ncbi:hypothetical protein [Cryptosporangium phraense]|uniref:Uncharacterized protein n=1 Tax=Cryptosporangium phraense TaxID=2593070 RepID=A0A545AGS7_9ACTN|nr:hypothetical protein [Cryptosporangium phraense]TQS40521.1 hypothetical protein FL583_34325 [Cryptosporangium phraense]
MTTLLSYWTPPRFTAAASPLLVEAVTALCTSAGSPPDVAERATVGDELQLVAQVLADVAADAEGRRRRPVPPVTEPGTIADQLTVLGNDVAAAGLAPTALDPLTDRLDALRSAL